MTWFIFNFFDILISEYSWKSRKMNYATTLIEVDWKFERYDLIYFYFLSYLDTWIFRKIRKSQLCNYFDRIDRLEIWTITVWFDLFSIPLISRYPNIYIRIVQINNSTTLIGLIDWKFERYHKFYFLHEYSQKSRKINCATTLIELKSIENLNNNSIFDLFLIPSISLYLNIHRNHEKSIVEKAIISII